MSRDNNKNNQSSKEEQIQEKLQNKLKYKNNSEWFFRSQRSVSFPATPPPADSVPLHLAGRPSTTTAGLVPRPPVGAAQTNLALLLRVLASCPQLPDNRVFSFS